MSFEGNSGGYLSLMSCGVISKPAARAIAAAGLEINLDVDRQSAAPPIGIYQQSRRRTYFASAFTFLSLLLSSVCRLC
jgi:hypothetical protein